jgi:hypothetical protein
LLSSVFKLALVSGSGAGRYKISRLQQYLIVSAIYIIMRLFIFLLPLTIITSCNNNSGGVRVRIPQNPGITNEFHPFLKEGMNEVEYFASKEVIARHKQLIKKLSKLIETNSRTQKYFRQIEEGGKPVYNSNIGISRQEYDELNELFSYKEPKKENGRLTIMRDGNHFKFQGEGRLSLLDSVIVNINNKTASFKQYNMSLVKDSIDLSSDDIPKGDTIEKYEFYRGPYGILGLSGLDGSYELLIGKLKPSGRTYLSFFAKQPDIIEHPIPELITVIFGR